MAQYTVLREKDIAEINRYFGFRILDFEPMVGGAGNSSCLAATHTEKLVVTVFDDKSFGYVSRLGKLLGHLAENNFPTTRVVTPENGRDPVMLYLDKPVMVKRFIPGEVKDVLDISMLDQAGVAMGELHNIAAPDFLPEEHPYGKQLFATVFDADIDPEYETWLAGKYEYLVDNIPAGLPRCLIHGDLFNDNILFAGNELQAMIDFEEACHYYRVFDLGMGIVGTCTEAGKINLEKAKAFVQGYQRVQTLEEVEINSLQLFVGYAAATTSYWRFWKYNIHEPMPDKAKLHWQMAEIADSSNAVDNQEFIKALFK